MEITTLEQSKVFKGLGTFPETFTIRLSEDAKPFALFTSRNVPIPLRKKVEKELARMESLLRRNGRGPQTARRRPHLLNESVQREMHPLPKVDNTLAQLAGATTFSKLNANSGFWQMRAPKS